MTSKEIIELAIQLMKVDADIYKAQIQYAPSVSDRPRSLESYIDLIVDLTKIRTKEHFDD